MLSCAGRDFLAFKRHAMHTVCKHHAQVMHTPSLHAPSVHSCAHHARALRMRFLCQALAFQKGKTFRRLAPMYVSSNCSECNGEFKYAEKENRSFFFFCETIHKFSKLVKILLTICEKSRTFAPQ